MYLRDVPTQQRSSTLLYEKIRRAKPVRERYTEELMRLGLLRPEDVARIEADLSAQLQRALQQIKTRVPEPDEITLHRQNSCAQLLPLR